MDHWRPLYLCKQKQKNGFNYCTSGLCTHPTMPPLCSLLVFQWYTNMITIMQITRTGKIASNAVAARTSSPIVELEEYPIICTNHMHLYAPTKNIQSYAPMMSWCLQIHVVKLWLIAFFPNLSQLKQNSIFIFLDLVITTNWIYVSRRHK